MDFVTSVFSNLDLLTVGVVTAFMGLLGTVVYFSNSKSDSNKYFFFFCLAAVTWSTINYLFYLVGDANTAFWVIRFVIASAAWFVFALFVFLSTFPNEKSPFSPDAFLGLFLSTATVSGLNLTPFVFNRIGSLAADGSIATIENGPGIALFGVFVFFCVGFGLFTFARKYLKSESSTRQPMRFILIGMAVTFALLLTFNFVLPAFFNNPEFMRFGALFIFPLIFSASVSLLRYKFLDAKAAAVAILTAFLAVIIFGEVIYAKETHILLFKVSEFLLVILFGILLIRGVTKEVRQREHIQRLAEDLKLANERQEGLLHFVGHEVKNFLTKDLGALSELVEGSYGALPDSARQFATRATQEAKKAVVSVSELLLASNQKKGTIAYKMEPFDFRALVSDAVESLKPHAAEKGLVLTCNAADGEYRILGDRGQLGDHVVRNLIDNAINYTLKGAISVSVARKPGSVVLSVKDTGKGIPPEDRTRLFTEGGRGKDSLKYNAHSTGYGLFITKGIIDAHKGSIRAESEGEGKGSTFIVELPVA